MNIKQLKKMYQPTQTILLLTFANVLLCFTKRNNRFVIVDCTGKTYPLNSYSNNLINTKNIDNSIQKCYFLDETTIFRPIIDFWELAILRAELAILSNELAILSHELAILRAELAILLGIFEPEHGIRARTCNLTEQKYTISFCFFVNSTLLVSWSVSECLSLVSWSST